MSIRFAGLLLVPLALLLDPGAADAAIAQAWPPFVLVTGLLIVGLIAGEDGLFDAAAARIVRLSGPPLVLLLACMLLVAVVTAVLNLDTAALFLTPVLIGCARRRGLDPLPFLYASVFMANASSLFLPGSNLTNLLVLSGQHVSGAAFLARMLPTALAATLLTAAGLLFLHRARLRREAERPPVGGHAAPVRWGVGLAASALAAVLMVLLRDAALAVLALGLIALAWRVRGGQLKLAASIARLGLPALLSLFGLSVALGTLARASAFLADALHSAGAPLTAVAAALASVLVNNLPAAVLLSSSGHENTRALLLGLNVGPNLAVSGSLAVLLWWRAAVAAGMRPSAIAYTRQGALLVPLALAGALAIAAM